MNINYNSKNKSKYTLIVLGVLVLIAMLFISNNIKKYYYSIMERETQTISSSYLHNIELAIDAYEITNKFLNERIIAVADVIDPNSKDYSNERLQEIAKALKVDHIYLYNKEGIIINSNIPYMLGWTPPINHPSYQFIKGNDSHYIGDIRASSVSGTYFKYGYVRLESGEVLQVGILADKIYSFLSNFDIQNLMEKIKFDGKLLEASFIGSDNKILGSSNKNLIGLDRPSYMPSLDTREGVSEIMDYQGERSYSVMVPVYNKAEKIGSLWLVHSMEKTNSVIVDAVYLFTIVLMLIFILLWIFTNQSEKNNKVLKKMIYYDELTGLKNYSYLKEYLFKELNSKSTNVTSLIIININKFKDINMTYGYEYGDRILKHISKKLATKFIDDFMIFRFNSDRFIILANDYKSKENLDFIIRNITNELETEFTLQGFKKTLTVNVGVIENISGYITVDELIRDATIALSYVDEVSDTRHAYFSEIMVDKINREEIIESNIINALLEKDNENLYLVYQPQINLITGEICGFEVLARLRSDSLGNISPIEFIEIAEKRNLIVPLGEWILKEALVFTKKLETSGYKNLKICINISGLQLLHEDFRATLLNHIKHARINPKNVELEITESIILKDFFDINKILNELRKVGITIAVDDFGTGYSSLSRLNQINIDTVKIDKSFIDRINYVGDNNLITADIISLCHKLGLNVIAEGVETKKQEKYLLENNCNYVQGYLYSKPILSKDALLLLEKGIELSN